MVAHVNVVAQLDLDDPAHVAWLERLHTLVGEALIPVVLRVSEEPKQVFDDREVNMHELETYMRQQGYTQDVRIQAGRLWRLIMRALYRKANRHMPQPQATVERLTIPLLSLKAMRIGDFEGLNAHLKTRAKAMKFIEWLS